MNIFQVLEQQQAFLRDFSPVLYSYKQELKKQGFNESQAFQLVRDYQISLMKGRNNNESN